MATRRLYQFGGTFDPKMCILDGYVALASSGYIKNGVNGLRPVPPVTDGYTKEDGSLLGVPKGLTSIVRNGTGDYTLNLQDAWTDLHHVGLTVVAVDAASSPTAADVVGQVYSWNVTSATQIDTVAPQTVNILFYTPGSTTKVDPPAGGGFTFSLALRNSYYGT